MAIINRELTRELFGAVDKAIGGHYKISGGTRVEMVGVTVDGKYRSLTEDPQPAMFLPLLQQQDNRAVYRRSAAEVKQHRSPPPIHD